LPSLELGLHLETDGDQLRFYDPVGQRWLPTPTEVLEQKDAVIEQKDVVIEQKDAELEWLRQELAALRRQA
ncbi:MAG: Uma2 family endonuclease, partial [Planctomycetota bacterium]|nr:Uma2 family endonuclease [Planctomycetota bacterium]